MGLFDALFRRSRPAESMPVQPAAEPDAPEEAGPMTILVANLQGLGEREEQEDSFAVLNATDPADLAGYGLFALVADGMGGMEGGKQASEWAASFFIQLFRERNPADGIFAFRRGYNNLCTRTFRIVCLYPLHGPVNIQRFFRDRNIFPC